jgi:hypothetical protein
MSESGGGYDRIKNQKACLSTENKSSLAYISAVSLIWAAKPRETLDFGRPMNLSRQVLQEQDDQCVGSMDPDSPSGL